MSDDPTNGNITHSFVPDDATNSEIRAVDRSGHFSPSLTDNHRFPVSDWDRYQFIRFLGAGGMGQVYLAYDPGLKRQLAIKFILYENRSIVDRFIQEARLQARIEHPNVCKIYEVGDVRDKLYIAMQYIDGLDLMRASGVMNFEQKVRIIKEIAEALQASHRLGLIHRDIKPSNIMVEYRDGIYHPYLMDFGLAKEVGGNDLTITGAIVGTPRYMSPEQARGDIHAIDRRSDIYSLGATLYEVLCGKPPFADKSNLEVVHDVIHEDPEPLRNQKKNIPRDLEIIVHKCLLKDPANRFDSARALADDLQRFLDGEPILSHPIGWSYRIGRKLRKHKGIAITFVIAIAAVIIISGISLHSVLQTRKQAQFANQFGQDIDYIEKFMEHAYASPLHDLTPEKDFVLNYIVTMEKKMRTAGRMAEGPGHYALARCYMVLLDFDKALASIRNAWKTPYRTEEVAFYHGLILGEFYDQERKRNLLLSTTEEQENLEEVFKTNYRDPALQFLRMSSHMMAESPEYVEALIARYEKDDHQALRFVESALQKKPWLLNATFLHGELLLNKAVTDRESGDITGSRDLFLRAEQVFRSILSRYPSHTRALNDLVDLLYEQVSTFYLNNELEIEEQFERSIRLSDDSLITDPRSYRTLFNKALLFSKWARYDIEFKGIFPREKLENSAAACRKAMELEPDAASPHALMGGNHWKVAYYELAKGSDPRESIKAAIDSYSAAMQRAPPQSIFHQNIGTAYLFQARYEVRHGITPQNNFDRAIQYLRKATELSPRKSGHFSDLGFLFLEMGVFEFESGRDPAGMVQQALTASSRALELNAANIPGYIAAGNALILLGSYELSHGLDPCVSINRALDFLQRGLKVNPDFYVTHCEIASALLIRGRHTMLNGMSPLDDFEQAGTWLESAFQLTEHDHEIHHFSGQLAMYEGLWLCEQDSDPHIKFDEAEQHFHKALSITPDSVSSQAHLMTLFRTRSELKQRNGDKASEEIRKGLEIAGQALGIRPQYGIVLAEKALLLLLQSKTVGNEQHRLELEKQAAECMETALINNANLAYEYRPLFERMMKGT